MAKKHPEKGRTARAAEPTARSVVQEPTYPKVDSVSIYLDEKGELAVDKEEVLIAAGGELTFAISDDDQKLERFTILMKKATPFGSGAAWFGGTKKDCPPVRIDGAANGTNPQGSRRYSYSILASDGERTYHKDPEVVVGPKGNDDDGTGGGG